MANQLVQSRRPRKVIHRRYLTGEICKRRCHGEEEFRIAHEPSTIWRNPILPAVAYCLRSKFVASA